MKKLIINLKRFLGICNSKPTPVSEELEKQMAEMLSRTLRGVGLPVSPEITCSNYSFDMQIHYSPGKREGIRNFEGATLSCYLDGKLVRMERLYLDHNGKGLTWKMLNDMTVGNLVDQILNSSL